MRCCVHLDATVGRRSCGARAMCPCVDQQRNQVKRGGRDRGWHRPSSSQVNIPSAEFWVAFSKDRCARRSSFCSLRFDNHHGDPAIVQRSRSSQLRSYHFLKVGSEQMMSSILGCAAQRQGTPVSLTVVANVPGRISQAPYGGSHKPHVAVGSLLPPANGKRSGARRLPRAVLSADRIVEGESAMAGFGHGQRDDAS
jgi:hypothetical protein